MNLSAFAFVVFLIQTAVGQDAVEVNGTPDTPVEPTIVVGPEYPLSALFAPLTEDALFDEANVGIHVASVESGEELYVYGGEDDYVPASVMKILTSAVALKTLGPQWRFSTAILGDEEASIDAEGQLSGNLYVWGGGDPTLMEEHLWRMVRDLKNLGVTSVEGDLVFDKTFFDDEHWIAGWRKQVDITNGPSYFAPLGALSVNRNVACLVVSPGLEADQPARVFMETPAESISIDSEVTTGREGARPWITVEREVDWDAGTMAFSLEGVIPVDEEDSWRYYRSVADPTRYFSGIFDDMLDAHGIDVGGQVVFGRAPEQTQLMVSHKSRPLHELLNHMNKYSSNVIAEHILKVVGGEIHGVPGTTQKGLDVVAAYLTDLGISPDDYTLVNGSGLSRSIRLRPAHVTSVLLDVRQSGLAPEFMASLAVGGRDGTLRRRFVEPEEVGQVRGKTGSLNGVNGLAGYVVGPEGVEYAFTVFVNDFSRSSRRIREFQDRLGAFLIHGGDPTAVDTEEQD